MDTIPARLKAIFEMFENSAVEGVSGVRCIASDVPGPVLGITACTHGNEPTGLAIFAHLLSAIGIEQTLERGTLFLVLNNVEASRRYLGASSREEIRKSRYCDVNMNRLSRDVLERKDDSRYEVRRVQELYPIWKQFEYGLDVHSTLEASDPMLISKQGNLRSHLVRGFPIPTLITDIDTHQLGLPAFALYGGAHSSSSVFGIEAGQHEEVATFERASLCATALLKNLGMLPGEPVVSVASYDEYQIAGSIMFPDMSYDFVRLFNHKEFVPEGDVLAESAQRRPPILMPFDGHLIMPSSRRGESKDISEEMSFLSCPMRTRIIE